MMLYRRCIDRGISFSNYYVVIAITIIAISSTSTIIYCHGRLMDCPSLDGGTIKTTGKACMCHSKSHNYEKPNLNLDFNWLRGAANDDAHIKAMQSSVDKIKCMELEDAYDLLGCEKHDSVTILQQRCSDSERTKCPDDPELYQTCMTCDVTFSWLVECKHLSDPDSSLSVSSPVIP